MLRPFASALLLLAAAPALSGCLTPKVSPPPSRAVLEARKGVGQKAKACQGGALADVSPALASFGFDETALDIEGRRTIDRVAAWLACHPGTAVVVLPGGDNHGPAEHQKDLAVQRGQTVVASLRAAGASAAVIHTLAPSAPDTLTGPHLVIQAAGRDW
jgi:outer membrane protein OmpA-like peptidoglycan-associated protein